jgi:hypothetical protein
MIMDIVNSKIEGKVLEAYYNEEFKEYVYIIKGPDNEYLVWIDMCCQCHMDYWNPNIGYEECNKGINFRKLNYDVAKIDCDIEVANNEEDKFVVRELVVSKGKFHNIVFKDKGIHNLGWR